MAGPALHEPELSQIIGAMYDGLGDALGDQGDGGSCCEPRRRLKVVGRAGIGVDNVDVAAATERGVVVMNTPFGNAVTTAEHAIAMMFALARQMPEASARPRRENGKNTASWASS